MLPKFTVKSLSCAAALLLGAGLFQGDIFREPLQGDSSKRPFKAIVKNVEYTIEPKVDYDIAGVVVSRHDSAAWWDWVHANSDAGLQAFDPAAISNNHLLNNDKTIAKKLLSIRVRDQIRMRGWLVATAF